MQKMLVSVAVALGASVALAVVNNETVTVSDTPGLVSELQRLNAGSGNVIQLNAGNYILPSEPMYVDASNGDAALSVNKVTLVGLGEHPEDVKLIGDYTLRGVWVAGGGWLKNLMITNCCSNKRGGGVYGGNITNCVITGCKGSHGGAVASATSLVGSRLYGNTGSYGGAVFGTSFSDCTLSNNTADEGGAAWNNGNFTIRDSWFIENTATAAGGGGIFQQDKVTTVTNCVFAGNSATTGGGGAAFGRVASTTAQVLLQDCVVTNNAAAKNGGGGYKCQVRGGLVAGNTAGADGGGLHTSSADGCQILNNTAKNGGGCHTCEIFSRCVVAGNRMAGGTGGGGLYASSAYDSVISNNYASAGHGGGIYNDAEQIVSNCTIYANQCSADGDANVFGGGIFCNSTKIKIVDCEVVGNYAKSATKLGLVGGVHQGTIVGGSVHDNYGDSDGGGCRQGVAVGTRIYNNDSGGNGKNCHSMRLIGCDVADNTVSFGSAYGCVFHDVVNGRVHALTNNPFKADHTYSSIVGVWNYYVNATNCLFRNNRGNLFLGTNAGGTKASLVNCTVVDNEIEYTFNTFWDPDNKLVVVNCAFVDNTDYSTGNPRDLHMSGTKDASNNPGMTIANSIYGVTTAKDIVAYAPDPSTLYQLGVNGIASSPRFNKDGEYPYEPKCSSPLVGRGEVQDWMTDAYDIRGDIDGGKYLRLRDGKADIGCYQCWLDPVGLMLLLR